MRIFGSRWGWSLLGLWLLASVAAAGTGEQLFSQGVGVFKRGDYSAALNYFRQAEAAGLETPTLYFNLGASAYKLGRYAEAESAFQSCARDPIWAPLANYNAGLSAFQRHDRAAAARYFDRAWRTAENDQISALALTMLERVDRAASRAVRAELTVNAGYDDNVTLAADSQTILSSGRSDYFSEILASATGNWGESSSRWRWNAALYDLRYTDLSENNITSILLGAGKSLPTTTWSSAVDARWEYVLRHGQSFQQIGSVRLAAVRDRPNKSDARVSLTFSTIDSLDNDFAFLDGSRQELAASLGQPLAGGTTRVGLSIERNDRADLSTATEFFSFSPLRYRLSFVGSWPFRRYWRLAPSAQITQSRYADADRRVSGVVAEREDNERQLTLRVTYQLTDFWRLFGDYAYLKNRSNFEEFSYSQHILLVGAKRPF